MILSAESSKANSQIESLTKQLAASDDEIVSLRRDQQSMVETLDQRQRTNESLARQNEELEATIAVAEQNHQQEQRNVMKNAEEQIASCHSAVRFEISWPAVCQISSWC